MSYIAITVIAKYDPAIDRDAIHEAIERALGCPDPDGPDDAGCPMVALASTVVPTLDEAHEWIEA